MQDHHSTNESFDVIVIGGGHAGCEAAITTAKLGFSTALFTINLDRIAWQPCNPAVGGPAKSQLVHEVDALGGIIGKLADETAMEVGIESGRLRTGRLQQDEWPLLGEGINSLGPVSYTHLTLPTKA